VFAQWLLRRFAAEIYHVVSIEIPLYAFEPGLVN